MSQHPKQPCSTCPYRTDVPLQHWDRAEFEGLLRAERQVMGAVYACHRHVTLDAKERGMCAGWLIDQKSRNVPSIALRIVLSRDDAAREAFETVTDGGLPLFESVEEMCEANYEDLT